jgi:hypothetical protein
LVERPVRGELGDVDGPVWRNEVAGEINISRGIGGQPGCLPERRWEVGKNEPSTDPSGFSRNTTVVGTASLLAPAATIRPDASTVTAFTWLWILRN